MFVFKVIVYIEDINDTPPRYEMSPSILFSENTLPGELVTTITVVDADKDGTIKFSLISGDTEIFNLDENSGMKLYTPIPITNADDIGNNFEYSSLQNLWKVHKKSPSFIIQIVYVYFKNKVVRSCYIPYLRNLMDIKLRFSNAYIFKPQMS